MESQVVSYAILILFDSRVSATIFPSSSAGFEHPTYLSVVQLVRTFTVGDMSRKDASSNLVIQSKSGDREFESHLGNHLAP